MPAKHNTYIAPGVTFTWHQPKGLFTANVNEHLLLLTTAAGEVLIAYIKLIRAYYSSFDDHKKIINYYYTEIGKKLAAIDAIIQPEDISRLIHQLGCLTDWPRHQPLH
ncbi:MAG: hypothetical protein J7623_05000 [Chitinophaga sp.]|uniref:hypothetical protein n=1 Tax=Chitinophaga sp. TaxID=1869181 RepID=UPI001B091022|nr:hypothetical protein [Chitinophaga sp.]MBO9727976.1 hypothetical protein [Chitinophaga sp.]